MRRSLIVACALTAFGTLAHGQRFAFTANRVGVHNLAGAMQIQGGSGSETIVYVTPQGPDRRRVRAEHATIRGEDAVRVVYPGSTIVYGGSREKIVQTTTMLDEDGTYRKAGVIDGKRMTVRATGLGTQAFADIRIIVGKGTQLTVSLAVGDIVIDNVDGHITADLWEGSIDVDGARGGASASVGTGTITVADARGVLSLEAGSGSIRIRDAWPDRIDAETKSAEVRAANIKVPSFRVMTGSGNIRMTSTELKTFSFETASGGIEAELITDIDSASIFSRSGPVILRIGQKVGAALDIITGRGGILTDLSVAKATRSPSELRGTIGDGRGLLKIEGGSGTVQLIRR
jgi:lia operon protein LiaG